MSVHPARGPGRRRGPNICFGGRQDLQTAYYHMPFDSPRTADLVPHVAPDRAGLAFNGFQGEA